MISNVRCSGEELAFSFLSDPAKLEEAIKLVMDFVKKYAIDTDYFDLNVVLYELFANAIRHGNKNCKEKTVDFKLKLEKTHFTMCVKDQGEGFDPAQYDSASENILEPDGRGVFIIRSLGYEMSYDKENDCLRLIKQYTQ